jgi:hypothetical protein
MMRLTTLATVLLLTALLIAGGCAYSQAIGDPASVAKTFLPWGAPVFGAIGGVIYELITLEGNVEWPHTTVNAEVPADGFAHAKIPFLFDLGIIARMIIGATAAIAVYWVLPPENGIRSISISLVAGFAGTAVFRSLQDRLLVAVKTAQVEAMKDVAAAIEGKLARIRGGRAAMPLAPNAGAVVDDADLAQIHGEIQALLVLASR